MLEDKRVAFLILAALNWAMQVQSVIPLDPAARSHRPFSMSGLLPNLAKNRWVSTHKLSVILSFTGGLKAHKLWEQLCSGLQRATLCLTYPPCLCAFLEATGEGGSNNSLALESVGPDIAQCNQHPICQLEKKKRTIQRTLDIARKETWSYFYTSGYLWFTLEEHRSPNFSCPRKVSDILTVMRAWGHRQHIRYQS